MATGRPTAPPPARCSSGQAAAAGVDVEQWLARWAQDVTLLGRLPTVAQVADAAVFLASDSVATVTAFTSLVNASVVGMDTWTRAARGVIRRRLLVNALVDPDEAAARLPAGLRPHVTGLGTVVGRCLLDIVQLRPAGLPAGVGVTLRAAACRIATEWDGEAGEPVVGVYVPSRLTDSRLALALGGRWLPGVHQRAQVQVDETADRSTWQVDAAGGGGGFGIRVAVATTPGSTPPSARDPVGVTCVGATLGLSPDRRGWLEAVRMDPEHRSARPVEVEELRCGFLAGFRSAKPAPTYLMEDVGVVWSPAPAPAPAPAVAPTRTVGAA